MDTVYYNVTYLCNLYCPYCYAPRNTFFVSQENNVAFLKKLVELNAKNIVLIGGEPMMHPKLDKIIDEIISYGFTSISIITNGTILKEKVLEKIVKYNIDIQISVDGYTEETNAPTRGKGSLNRVLKNIDILKQNNVNYSVMQVLTKETIKNSEEFSEFFSKKGIPHGFF
ncbi:TPA: radical SAM protein, partial [Enterococcus faecium]